MPRSAVSALALLLLLVPTVALGGYASPDRPAAAAGDGVHGSLGTPQRSAFATASVSVTSSLGASSADLAAMYSKKRFAARWSDANGSAERRALVRNATARIANRTDALARTEADARTAFAAGRLSASAFVRRLALDGARAQSLMTYLDAVSSKNTGLSRPVRSAAGRLAALRGRLAAYALGDAGVRRDLVSTASGDRAPTRVSVTVSGDALRVSAIAGNTYTSATDRLDNYDAATGGVTFTAFSNSLATRYPDVWNLSSDRYLQAWPQDAYYQATLNYRRSSSGGSTLTAYFDPSTDAVYREERRVRIADLVPGPGVVRHAGNTTLVVNRTYVGGPLRVAAYNASGGPVAVPVTVNGTRVGSTTPDTGETWALSPAGNYTVGVVRHGSRVSVHTSALPG